MRRWRSWGRLWRGGDGWVVGGINLLGNYRWMEIWRRFHVRSERLCYNDSDYDMCEAWKKKSDIAIFYDFNSLLAWITTTTAERRTP